MEFCKYRLFNLPSELVAYLEFIVIDLDPVPIRILQVDLLDLVGPNLRRLGILRPVAIFDIHGIQVLRENIHRRDAKGQVYIDIMRDILLGTRDDMQLSMLRQPEPHMLAVVERLRISV
jgi:hypothetical protein